VAAVALALLGQSADPAAVDVMIASLRSQSHPASRIAVHLEHSPQQYAERLRPLLNDHDPIIRMWSATLLGRYTDVDGLEAELAPLADDPDPRVRKAAVVSLGKVGDRIAAATALRLLRDPEGFVRAHAARAVGELNRGDMAAEVVSLLSDHDWWVRRAAKDALEVLGMEIWPVLVRCLDDPDVFVRNGAAELFQNLGVLDNLIIMEAATDNPSEAKIEMLKKITAAGGGRLTNAVIERSGPAARARVRQLLTTIGMQRVAAC
jgi:HEAT repeat protein